MGTGDVLAGRYRLVAPVTGDEEPAAAGGPAAPWTLWQATDEVLARPVAVKVLRSLGAAEAGTARRFLAAAGTAARPASPVLARVYDAALEERPAERYGRPAGPVDVAYVVSEWVEGRSLAQVLDDDGPFDPQTACAMALELAEALTAAHAAGAGHGRLHPGNLLVTWAGRPKITDTAVAAALHGLDVGGTDGLRRSVVAADTRDLAAVLYALLTGRWPGSTTPQPARGLPLAPGVAAPRTAGSAAAPRTYSPRQVRAGVPRAVDLTVARALEPERHPSLPPLDTPERLAGALVTAVGTDYPVPVVAVPRQPRLPARARRLAPLLGVLLLLTTVGTGSYLVGMAIGEVQPERDPFGALVQSTDRAPEDPPAAAAVESRVELPAAAVTDFDPPPGDGAERPDTVPFATDGDPATAWLTERYESADLGGLKTGVGLLVDLGSPTSIARVEVALNTPGADVQLRAADAPGPAAEDFRVLAEVTDSGALTRLAPAAPTSARYWLVWLTRLPAQDGRFSAGVADLAFVRG